MSKDERNEIIDRAVEVFGSVINFCREVDGRRQDLEEANQRLLKENEELKGDEDLLQVVRWGLLEAEKALDDELEKKANEAMFLASKRLTDAIDALSNMRLAKELRDDE